MRALVHGDVLVHPGAEDGSASEWQACGLSEDQPNGIPCLVSIESATAAIPGGSTAIVDDVSGLVLVEDAVARATAGSDA